MNAKLSTQSAVALPVGGVLSDHVVPGLELWRKKSGAFWFLYYRTETGQRRRPKLSAVAYPQLGIEQAREKAKEWLRAVARGEDPSADKTAQKRAPRVRDLAERYIEFKAKTNDAFTMQILEIHRKAIVSEIGDVLVSEVTVEDVEKVLKAVLERKYTSAHNPNKKTAPAASNRTRETIRGMLNFAERPSVKWREHGSNPIVETTRHKEAKRKVHITETQLKDVSKALQDLATSYPRQVAALFCILFCGSRVTELLEATAADYDGEKITRSEHKTDRTGDDRVIFLPVQARRIIEMLPITPDEPRIFGGIDKYAVRYVWDKARDAAGVPDVQVRDFRRTFASFALSRANVGLDGIGELLGHREHETTMGYSWLTDSAAGEAAQRTADVMEQFMIEGKAE